MQDSQSPAADWVQNLIRDYQDTLTCGLYEAIYRLQDGALDTLMEGQARTCVAAYLKLTALPAHMEMDAFLEAIQTAGPSQVEIQREGNVIHWRELHQGQCICPFVRRGVVRLDPKLCICGAYWVKHLFETVTKTPVEVEMIETAATGAQDCRFRITLKAEAAT